jgi:hypothetical protein
VGSGEGQLELLRQGQQEQCRAADWLRVRQRVRLVDTPDSVDPAYGIQRFLGRAGVVWRLCRGFDDHCYVFFDPVGGERKAKIEFVQLRDLEPVL